MAGPQSITPQPKIAPKMRKWFKLEEANRSLPLVMRVVRDVVHTHRRVSDLQAKLDQQPVASEAAMLQRELELAVDRLGEYAAELTEIGCELKDYETGLIDFPGHHKGREVCLCWKLGEERISYWHEREAGFAGRQPVSQLDESA